jgi:hypothetical protein
MAVCKGCKTFQNGNKQDNLKLKGGKNDILIAKEKNNRKVGRLLGRSVRDMYGKWKERS